MAAVIRGITAASIPTAGGDCGESRDRMSDDDGRWASSCRGFRRNHRCCSGWCHLSRRGRRDRSATPAIVMSVAVTPLVSAFFRRDHPRSMRLPSPSPLP